MTIMSDILKFFGSIITKPPSFIIIKGIQAMRIISLIIISEYMFKLLIYNYNIVYKPDEIINFFISGEILKVAGIFFLSFIIFDIILSIISNIPSVFIKRFIINKMKYNIDSNDKKGSFNFGKFVKTYTNKILKKNLKFDFEIESKEFKTALESDYPTLESSPLIISQLFIVMLITGVHSIFWLISIIIIFLTIHLIISFLEFAKYVYAKMEINN